MAESIFFLVVTLCSINTQGPCPLPVEHIMYIPTAACPYRYSHPIHVSL